MEPGERADIRCCASGGDDPLARMHGAMRPSRSCRRPQSIVGRFHCSNLVAFWTLLGVWLVQYLEETDTEESKINFEKESLKFDSRKSTRSSCSFARSLHFPGSGLRSAEMTTFDKVGRDKNTPSAFSRRPSGCIGFTNYIHILYIQRFPEGDREVCWRSLQKRR